jgi:DNA-binding PadR family transcriptional regulator
MSRTGPLGEFEHLVLLAVMRHPDGVFGAHIGRELETVGRRVSRGALYAALERLQRKGLLAWTIEDAGPERGGHPRRRFAVTADGRASLREYQRAVRKLSAGIESLL